MKKFFAILLAVAFILPAYAASPAKQLEKAREKQRKEAMNGFKKDGYKVFGSAKSLEVALLEHYAALDASENTREIHGVSSRSKSKNVGMQMAQNNACVNYAQMCGSTLNGKIVSDMAGSGVDVDKEFENFFAGYKRYVEKEIRGEMKQSFSLIKENADGTFEIQTFYVVNEDRASAARMRALQNAMAESDVAREHAEKIAKFVDEGLD